MNVLYHDKIRAILVLRDTIPFYGATPTHLWLSGCLEMDLANIWTVITQIRDQEGSLSGLYRVTLGGGITIMI